MFAFLRFPLILTLVLSAAVVSGQDLEPRAYSNAPVGLQFVVIGFGHSTGDLVFEPTVPIENADASVNGLAAGYVRTLSIFGKTGNFAIVVPWADGKAQGLLNGEPAERILKGLGDAKIRLSWLFYGAPARDAVEFMAADRSRTVAGLSFVVGVPTGRYEEERLLNIGTNRYSLKTEIGVTHRLAKWSLEAAAAASFFQDNDEFLVTSTFDQDPIYSVQAHLVRDFGPRVWAAFDATYYWGGQGFVDGEISGTALGNSRMGLTLSLRATKTQSLKFTTTSGISTRTGTDFDSYGVAWQWAIPRRM